MSSKETVEVKLSDGRDLTELFRFLMEENARMEEELGPVEDVVYDNIEKSLEYLPDHFKNICRDLFELNKLISNYLFDKPDSSSNIEYNSQEEIISATFTKLIEKATEEGSSEISNILFHTYPVYGTDSELLKMLINRHNVPIPPMMAPSEIGVFHAKKIRSIQSKVASLFKKWVRQWPGIFMHNSSLRNTLQSFLEDLSSSTSESFVKTNCSTILNCLESLEEKKEDKTSFGEMKIPPSPVLPKEIDFKTEPLLIWSPLEVARQLTIIELELLKKVQIGELLEKNWEKPNKQELAPNVVEINKRFLNVSLLYLSAIVNQSDPNNRVRVVKNLLEIANECINELHNYESPHVIKLVLKSDAVRALDSTCKKVKKSTTHKNIWEKLESLYDPQFVNIKQEMATNQTVVPCFLALRQELTQIDAVFRDVNESGLVNLVKHRATSDVIEKIRLYQENLALFHPVRALSTYLRANDIKADQEELTSKARTLERE